jgi:hypothetical protein
LDADAREKPNGILSRKKTTMRVKDLKVVPVPLSAIRELIETIHYSHSVNGLRVLQCFGLYDEDRLIGGMVYGGLGMANAWKRYADTEADVVELRRLAVIDDTPPTTESYFIGKTLRWLTQNTTLKTVVSYADNTQGHVGTIYKASNFQFKGETAKGKMLSLNGKLYHDKSLRTTYIRKDGTKTLKPFAQRLKDALAAGDATWVATKTKNIYVYPLRNRTLPRG